MSKPSSIRIKFNTPKERRDATNFFLRRFRSFDSLVSAEFFNGCKRVKHFCEYIRIPKSHSIQLHMEFYSEEDFQYDEFLIKVFDGKRNLIATRFEKVSRKSNEGTLMANFPKEYWVGFDVESTAPKG